MHLDYESLKDLQDLLTEIIIIRENSFEDPYSNYYKEYVKELKEVYGLEFVDAN